ncbi:putative photosynthetic complex assembly protein PuhE [Roseobacter weihaiensis]|uniref:putative photosynthetic complex assembly protein PuhE n=1 Tax=Roseobacter weihaiensis TaxID=2763262 RepID=UPI001D09F7A8|nr:putative photosynthetic complex assembly protein PuhE [Roseobacter sp. H9]
MTVWTASLLALFVWWFSTGAILWVVKTADRKGGGAGRRATLWGLPMAGLGVWGFWASLGDASILGACVAFLSAILIWGWIELAFLTGVVTGPNAYPLRPDAPEWERFIRAWGTLAYHEMLLVATLITLLLIGWNYPNIFGLWTFAILFFARLSAKLNLYLGVPHINVDFLPGELKHLSTYFRIRPLNWLFPISVSALTFATACWLERIHGAETDGQIIGFALLAAITALALLEHWVMVLPIPDEKLWRWMLPAPKQPTPKPTTLKGGHHGL